jgi:hypothetical protein
MSPTGSIGHDRHAAQRNVVLGWTSVPAQAASRSARSSSNPHVNYRAHIVSGRPLPTPAGRS